MALVVWNARARTVCTNARPTTGRGISGHGLPPTTVQRLRPKAAAVSNCFANSRCPTTNAAMNEEKGPGVAILRDLIGPWLSTLPPEIKEGVFYSEGGN